jgi:hypothetical protein
MFDIKAETACGLLRDETHQTGTLTGIEMLIVVIA